VALDLITKADYKAYAGIVSEKQDTILDTVIPKVSSFVKKYCRRSFVDYVNDIKIETFNGAAKFFLLEEGPISLVLSVEYSDDYGQTFTELTEYTDYYVDLQTDRIMAIADEFPLKQNGYQVTYTGGYAIADLPEDIKIATMDMVSYYLKNDAAVHSNKAPGTNTVQIEYVSSSGLPSNIKRVLDLHKNHYA
jgi:hypothetical protein